MCSCLFICFCGPERDESLINTCGNCREVKLKSTLVKDLEYQKAALRWPSIYSQVLFSYSPELPLWLKRKQNEDNFFFCFLRSHQTSLLSFPLSNKLLTLAFPLIVCCSDYSLSSPFCVIIACRCNSFHKQGVGGGIVLGAVLLQNYCQSSYTHYCSVSYKPHSWYNPQHYFYISEFL